tara:strand:+ start:5942 stop:8395 length:2454 start_codon:yes stop_codon:yes gene_type:complete
MVFLKAHISNREDDIHFLIKCLIEHIDSDITKKDEDPERTKRLQEERTKRLQDKFPNTPKKLLPKNIKGLKEKGPEKMDSMKVSGEQIYQTVRSKQALQQLKELQSNPSIKTVLDRLKKPAFSFSIPSDLSSKERTELLEESLTASNAGKTREVLRYVINALEAVKDTQDGGASKKSAAAIIDKIKEEDKRLNAIVRSKAPKNIQDNLAMVAPTLAFWKKLAAELKEIHTKLTFPLDKNSISNSSILKPLVDMGDGLVAFILDNIDKTQDSEKEVDIPAQHKAAREKAQDEAYASFAASSKVKKAQSLPYASSMVDSSKTTESGKSVRFIDMIDFTGFKNGRVKVRPRTLAYDEKTNGIDERNKSIEIIKAAKDRKEFKEVSLGDIVKRYAGYRNEGSPKSRQKSDVKEIQAYMAERKKEIIASLDRKVRMPKVPKTLLAKYEKLNNEIVDDLQKYYAFTLRKNSIDIQEGDLKRIENDSGFEMILAIREGPSDIGNQLKELIEVAKRAEDDKQKELDKETLDEYIRLGQSIIDLEEDFTDHSKTIEELVGQGKQLKRIVDLVNYISLAKERYPQIKSAIEKLPKPKEFKSMFDRKDPRVRLKNLLNVKNNFEKEVIAKIKKFGGDKIIRNYSLDKENPSNLFISQLNEAELNAEMGEELDIAGLTTLYESASEERLREIFEFFEKYQDFEFFDDLKIDIDTQTKDLKKIQNKIEEVKIYFNHTTTEREEQQMLLEFIEIKAKKLRGEKVTDKSEMLKLLAERFRNNPVFTIEGKKITEYPEIAAYLEEKYEDVTGVDDGELKDFLDSAQENKEEEE